MAFTNVLQPGLFRGDDAPRAQVKAKPASRPKLRYPPTGPDWAPDPIPELRGETRIVLNCETTGLKWWDGDRPIGWAYELPQSGRRGYLPIRHEGGGNLPVERVHDFLHDVRGMHVENTNTKFDLHMAREDDCDLIEETGNTFGDAAHYAALLDDNRLRFGLDQLSKELLGWDVNDPNDALGPLPPGITTEATWSKLHAKDVAPYARRNVEQVTRLIDALTPKIREENLDEVLALEQDVIPVVVEMERNGTYLDMELLQRWRRDAQNQLEDNLFKVYKSTGILVSSPDSSKDLLSLFRARGIAITSFTEHGAPSFTSGVMMATDDECVQAIYQAGQLADLLSKYLNKYEKAARSDGWLRFNLHQLKSTKDDGDHVGTVSGRFSSAGDRFGGFNVQQVVAVEKQLERGWCPDFVVRKLFREPGGLMLASDMMQVEYRLFAHYAGAAKVLAAYANNPLTDYHKVVMDLLHTVAPHLNRKLVKNINFAKIYGAGLVKFALMLGFIDEALYKHLVARQRARERVKDEPCLDGARQLMAAYDLMFPDVAPLLRKASQLAEHRGYVMDLIGRRARLTGRYHSALNRIIQGGAASINKRVVVEVHKHRKALGLTMRATVHDELVAGLHDASTLDKTNEILNAQYYNLKVPILWETKTGASWAECK